ncbi:type I-U CRISPR-associated protein Csx17 [bacterium]|nr:type I-U CRISPR-associated protein Csx17 [candidate division CSSED10-310 bacterium]
MNNDIREINLTGCRTEPIAFYLKSLGIVRLLAEQNTQLVRSFVRKNYLVILSSLSEKDLMDFFLFKYIPTPILSPWNGGSGFFPKDQKKAFLSIANSTHARFSIYRDSLLWLTELFNKRNILEKPDKQEKNRLLNDIRSTAHESLLKWLDAVYLLTSEGVNYPPMLGTGGNDGRLEFSNNFMQRIIETIDPVTGQPVHGTDNLLKASLFESAVPAASSKNPIGQFNPGVAGGANAGFGFEADAYTNPWDYILMMEGALTFATSCNRYLNSAMYGVMNYPFTVATTNAGFGSASENDTSRAEMWMPIWHKPSTYSEIKHLFSEGRVMIGRRPVRDGLDFARAVSSLSVDRGIEAFQRFSFQERNGQSYLAMSLGRWHVKYHKNVKILDEIDPWMDAYRRAVRDRNAPGTLRTAFRNLESSAISFCRHDDSENFIQLLFNISAAEQAIAGSRKFSRDKYLQPIKPLSIEWLKLANDQTVEFRLAAAIASIYDFKLGSLRMYLEPVMSFHGHVWWRKDDNMNMVVWRTTDPIKNMIAVLKRRCMDAGRQSILPLPLYGKYSASLNDIASFISGSVRLDRLSSLVHAFSLMDWEHFEFFDDEAPDSMPLPAGYAMFKLCFIPFRLNEKTIPYEPAIIEKLNSGSYAEAISNAYRRLFGSGFPTRIKTTFQSRDVSLRTAAALLFPISKISIGKLEHLALIIPDNV